VEQYTILPQNEHLSHEWRDMLGPDWQRIQNQYLHSLGNLTLTGYNAEYSDRPFSKKRDMTGGFHESPLRLNKGLGQLDRWDEAAIQTRARALAEQARTAWAAPAVDADVLLVQSARPTDGYTIGDHPNLLISPIRELFEAFRKAVLALDPCVTEEFRKFYVAYKAETNMEFPDIYDPRGMARDITDVGRWGNGDIEVGISSFDDLPYVMGLVRQSLEQQLGSGGEA
jgi:predicted transport protein